MKKKGLTLQEKAELVLKEAEEKGFNENYYFASTFKRYQTQIQILEKLEQEIENTDLIIEKNTTSGKVKTTNPAVSEYNKTSSAANNSVITLMKIIESLEITKPKSTGFSRMDDDDDEE